MQSKKKISVKEAKEGGGKKYKEKIKKIIDDYNKLPDEKKHQLHVYYGYGKGKTTAAIGLAIRALGAGKRVAIVELVKDGRRVPTHGPDCIHDFTLEVPAE